MKPSTASLSTGALLAMVGLICVALPIDPAQPIEPASSPESNGNWLLFEHPDIAHQHHQQRSQSHSASESELQVVREKRQASSKKKKTKPDKKKSFEKECLVAHNKWRKLHQAEPLVWDKKITEFSRKRANFIAESDGSQFKHPADLEYGENLAWHSRETTSCSDLIKMWYDEVEIYDFNKAKFDHETGHFTQLVWRSTRSVGCARAISTGPNGGVYLVCNYDPPGNFLGEELKNVLAAMEKVNSARAPSPPPPSPPKPATTSTTVASTTTSTSTVAPTSGSGGPDEATSGSSSAAKKNKKNKKTDKNKRKKKGNKNKKNKKRRNKKKASTSTSTTTTTTTTIATPTG